MSTAPKPFQPTTGIVKFTVVALVLSILLRIAILAFNARFYHGGVPEPLPTGAGRIYKISELLKTLSAFLLLLRIIGVAAWMYRATANLNSLGVRNAAFTPARAAGSLFIPVANLWWPYLAVSAIWRGSAPPIRSSGDEPVVTWWFITIVAAICDLAIAFAAQTHKIALQPGDFWAGGALTVLSCILTIRLLLVIDHAQVQRMTGMQNIIVE